MMVTSQLPVSASTRSSYRSLCPGMDGRTESKDSFWRSLVLTLLAFSCLGCQKSEKAARFAPVLLKDTDEMEVYLEAFPVSDYDVFTVENIGRFYLDDRPEWVKKTLREGQPWEPHVLAALAQATVSGTTAIDIGAHIGSITLPLAKLVGSTGHVYAFEPQKRIFRELVHNLRLNEVKNVTALRFAAGSELAIIRLDPDSEWDGQIGIGSGGDAAELRALDSFLFTNVSVIKIDVEGYELEVLRGARQTIADWHPAIVIEVWPAHFPRVQSFLGEMGYTLSSLQWDPEIPKHDYIGMFNEVPLSKGTG